VPAPLEALDDRLVYLAPQLLQLQVSLVLQVIHLRDQPAYVSTRGADVSMCAAYVQLVHVRECMMP
jgi:hypothetical protein